MVTETPVPSAATPPSPIIKVKKNIEKLADRLTPTYPQKEGFCLEWIIKKGRYCNIQRCEGSTYCPNHTMTPTKVPCPYDGKHSIEESKLHKHLKKCSSKPIPKPAYFNLDCNIAQPNQQSDLSSRDAIMGLKEEELNLLFNKIDTLFEKCKEQRFNGAANGIDGDFKWSIGTHSSMDSIIKGKGGQREKHSIQITSILALLSSVSLLETAHNFIEFGSGKAALSHSVNQSCGKPNKITLVDRKNMKSKFADHRYDEDCTMEKLLIDIKDLDLSKKIEENKNVILSKHLCGAATDLTLCCLKNFVENKPDGIKGMCIALCCHQICSYKAYCNPSFLEQNQITPIEFACFCFIATWYTRGRKLEKEETAHWSGIAFEKREELGFKVKRILDAGRIEFIKEKLKFDHVELRYYVEKRVSLENLVLLVWND